MIRYTFLFRMGRVQSPNPTFYNAIALKETLQTLPQESCQMASLFNNVYVHEETRFHVV